MITEKNKSLKKKARRRRFHGRVRVIPCGNTREAIHLDKEATLAAVGGAFGAWLGNLLGRPGALNRLVSMKLPDQAELAKIFAAFANGQVPSLFPTDERDPPPPPPIPKVEGVYMPDLPPPPPCKACGKTIAEHAYTCLNPLCDDPIEFIDLGNGEKIPHYHRKCAPCVVRPFCPGSPLAPGAKKPARKRKPKSSHPNVRANGVPPEATEDE